jgi:glycosyltransferase involved in cell wall biosynthesis
MRIALNMLFVAPGVAGGRVYCEGLLKALQEIEGRNEYVVYTRRAMSLPPLDPARFRQVEAPVAPASTLWRTLWEYRRLPRLLRHEGFDLFHGLGTLSPSSRSCPFILTIHDLIYRHFPASLPLGHRSFMRWVHPAVARRADRVIVPSRATARDAVAYLGVKEERLRLVPYGPGNDFRPVTDAKRIEATLRRYAVRRPYLISVARSYAHKNLAGLLRAYRVLRERGRRDVQLVLVGERYRTSGDLDRLAEELEVSDGVVFTGFVGHDELNALYSGAEVFAFPSLAEGFGLPVLEAMACGAPVVASDASAVPEAVGDAGIVADARDPEAFAAGLARMLEDNTLRAECRKRGLAWASRFTWESNARATLAAYGELA